MMGLLPAVYYFLISMSSRSMISTHLPCVADNASPLLSHMSIRPVAVYAAALVFSSTALSATSRGVYWAAIQRVYQGTFGSSSNLVHPSGSEAGDATMSGVSGRYGQAK